MCSGTAPQPPSTWVTLSSPGELQDQPKSTLEPQRPNQAGWELSHLPGSAFYSCRAAWNRDKLQGSLGTETNSVSNHFSAGSLQVEWLCQVSARLLVASTAQWWRLMERVESILFIHRCQQTAQELSSDSELRSTWMCSAAAGREAGWLQPCPSALQNMLPNASLCSMKGKHIFREMPRKTADALLTF